MILVKALLAFVVFGSLLAFALAIVAGIVWCIVATNSAYGFVAACMVYVTIKLLTTLVISAVAE